MYRMDPSEQQMLNEIIVIVVSVNLAIPTIKAGRMLLCNNNNYCGSLTLAGLLSTKVNGTPND